MPIYSKKLQCNVSSSVIPLPWKRQVAMLCWFSWSSWVVHVLFVTGIAAVQKKSWIIVLWLVPGRTIHPTSQLVICKNYCWPLVVFCHPEAGGNQEDAEVAIPQWRGMSPQLLPKCVSILLLSWLEPTAFCPRAGFYQLMISHFHSISCATYELTKMDLLFLTYFLQYGPWFYVHSMWRWWSQSSNVWWAKNLVHFAFLILYLL